MAWWTPGWETAGREIAERWRTARWGDLPEGFAPASPPRPMRIVAVGRWPGTPGAVYVKWSRPRTRLDRLRRHLRGGKGRREGRTLLALDAAGLEVPRVLGWTDDLLVTEAWPDLRPLAPWEEAPRAQAAAVGAFLARAWRAGLRHRDLTAANLARVDGRVVLVDAGGARRGPAGGAPLALLAAARHGVFEDASPAQRLRALAAFLEASGLAAGRAARRRLARRVERVAARLRRRYRRGRDRRATRTGRHFVRFARHGIRRREAPASWQEPGTLEALLRGATPLKAGGRVVRARPEEGPGAVVLKRYAPAAPGRRPRAVNAFRRQVQLEHRGVAAPRALLAGVLADGTGVLVSEAIDAPDLHRFLVEGRLEGTTHRARRRLARALGRFLRRLHDAEVIHRDLKAPNLLVDAEGLRVWICDLEGARVYRRPVGWRRRARDLARLDASLAAARTDRLSVFEAYWNVHPRPAVDRRAFLARIRQHVAAKRGPSNLPR